MRRWLRLHTAGHSVGDHEVMPIPLNHPLRLQLAGRAPELLDGDAGAVGLSLRRLTLTAGTELAPPAPGVMVVVGGNNVGKSTLLREIHQRVQAVPSGPLASIRLLESLVFEPAGTPADLVAWLVHHAPFTARPGEAGGLVPIGGGAPVDSRILRLDADRMWSSDARSGSLWPFAPFLVSYADTAARLGLSDPAPVREDAQQAPTHPVHALADNPAQLARADELCSRILASTSSSTSCPAATGYG